MRKIRNIIVKIGKWFDDKKIMIGMGAIFIATIIPMLIVAKYSHASADDFGWNAAMRRQVWNDTHSILKVMETAIQNTKEMYYGWQGTFTTTFVQAFQPEIFNINAYFIIPYIMISLFCIGTALLLYYIMVRLLKISKSIYGIVTFLYFIITIQYIPSTGEAFYWFNGAVAYTLAYIAMLFCLYFSVKFIFTKKKRNLGAAIFMGFFVGGGNYLTIVLLPLLLILIIFLFTPTRKHSLYLLLPFGVFLVTAVINMKAPGTLVRGGSDFGVDMGSIFTTIFRSIYQGLKDIRSFYMMNPVIMICFILMALFIIAGMISQTYEFTFRYPLLFIAMTLGSYFAMYAPTYYAGVGEPFGRMSNLISFYFELSIILDILYVTGYLMRIIKKKMDETKVKSICAKFTKMWNTYKIYIMLVSALLIAVNVNWYQTTAMARTVTYLTSGEAAQFGREMDMRYNILLDDNIMDAVLEPLTVSAGTLFHYELMDDPDLWPNNAIAEFFNKDSVRLNN